MYFRWVEHFTPAQSDGAESDPPGLIFSIKSAINICLREGIIQASQLIIYLLI